MKSLLPIVFSLFIVNNVISQKPYIIEAKMYFAPDHSKIRIPKLKIIDNRDTKENIGHIFKGGKIREAKFEKNFMYGFQNILELVAEEDTSSNMILTIHELEINEEIIAGTKYGKCKIEIEFIREIDNKFFSAGIYEANIRENKTNVRKTHDDRIIRALSKTLNAFKKTKLKQHEAVELDINNLDYKFDTNYIPPKGLYTSLGQLARKLPISEEKYKIEIIRGNAKFDRYWCKFGKSSPNKYVNYVSDGKSIFLVIGYEKNRNLMLKSKSYGRYLYFVDKSSDPNMSMAFGLLGSLISSKARPIILDTFNNKFSMLDMDKAYRLTTEYPEIFKTFKNSKRKLEDYEKLILELNSKY